MAALTRERATRMLVGPTATGEGLPVKASTKIYKGSLVGVDSSGNALPAASTGVVKCVGRARRTVDNSSGSAGDLDVEVEYGVFLWANGDSIASPTDVDKPCYASDDQTVTKAQGGVQPFAGWIYDVDSNGVWVDTHPRNYASFKYTNAAIAAIP